MRKKICLQLLLLFIAAISTAQSITPLCQSNEPLGKNLCYQTCVRCFWQGITDINMPVNGPSGVTCSGAVTFHNPRWYAFIAGSNDIGFDIIPTSSMSGDGLQAMIFENCSDPDPLVCYPGTSQGFHPISIFYGSFIPGRTYYLAIDGFAGDICDYTIDLLFGSVNPPAPGPAQAIQSPASVCAGGTTTLNVPQVQNVGYYTWKAPASFSFNGGGNVLTIPAPQGISVNLTAGNTSGQISVEAGNQCYPIQSSSKFIQVTPSLSVLLAPLNITFNELPYTWTVDGWTTLTTPGTYNLSTTLTSWQGCDSIISQKIIISAPKASIHAFWDTNPNGVLDGADLNANGVTVSVSTGDLYTLTNGFIQLDNLMPGDTVRVLSPFPGAVVTPDFAVIGSGFFNQNFLIQTPPGGIQDLQIDLTNTTPFRPGFNTKMVMTVTSLSSLPIDQVKAIATVLSPLKFVGSPWPYTYNGNDYTWELGALLPGQKRVITFDIVTPFNVSLGTPVEVQSFVEPVNGDFFSANNYSNVQGTTLGAYDPNDKQVKPEYVTPQMLNGDQAFEYTIRFQNTGTYYATFVRILDTLSEQLDLKTLKFISSSHDCTWKVEHGELLNIFFKDIFLPDSNTNEPASHGFAKFSIKPKKGLGIGAKVENFCDIYFDYNAPVRTNTTGTEVVYFIPGAEPSGNDQLILRPNPAAFYLMCNWQTPAPAAGTLRLYNLMGQQRVEIPVAEMDIYQFIALQDVPAGIYIAVLDAGGLLLSNKVVVVKDLGTLGF